LRVVHQKLPEFAGYQTCHADDQKTAVVSLLRW
jgi:hypothetical protein